MTITQNASYALEHPFLKRACENFLSGDKKDMRFLIELIHMDMYQEVASSCAKAYRKQKHENFPIIEKAIREVEPPINLNLRLPIPMPKADCVVVTMRPKKLKIKSTPIVGQLCFDFKFA